LIDHSARVGDWFLGELEVLATRHPQDMANVRGRGLMCAFDLPSQAGRDDAIRRLHEERVLALACGERSIRFRPALNVTIPDLEFGLAALERVLS
jgi:L-lysine 6-transaminase